MKKFIVYSFIVLATCNQQIYDGLYVAIIQNVQTTKFKNDKQFNEALKNRNKAIRVLRDLCNGQKSNFEK